MITGFFIGLAIGIIAGLALAFIFKMMRVKSAKELAEELYQKNEAERLAATSTLIENLKASFGSISLDSLSKANEQLLTLAKSKLETEREVSAKELEAKKSLIDQELKSMNTQLENVGKLMNDLEKDRREKFGELATQLKNTSEQTLALTQTTNSLREVLASSRARGQWGERMAEDILQKAGFIETVNYDKQKVIEGDGSRPDFTFHLPNNLKLNMDVKFPLDNYLKFLNAGSDNDKEKCCGDFLRDVRARFKEITTREYINTGTLDCVLLFIPSEQIYTFIWLNDSSIIDDGLKNKIICCSPINLYAILIVMRQAMSNFMIEKKSNEILALMGNFRKQWTQFVEKFDDLGERIKKTQDTYSELTGTRRRQLDRAVEKIDDLREERGIEAVMIEGSTEEASGDVKEA